MALAHSPAVLAPLYRLVEEVNPLAEEQVHHAHTALSPALRVPVKDEPTAVFLVLALSQLPLERPYALAEEGVEALLQQPPAVL